MGVNIFLHGGIVLCLGLTLCDLDDIAVLELALDAVDVERPEGALFLGRA